MGTDEPWVFVVDDDPALCESLSWLLETEMLPVRSFESAEAFLEFYQPDMTGCLVLDLRMRGMSGTELQAKLAEFGATLPIIMITGHGDVPSAVKALKGGAVDFLEKPVDPQTLVQRIRAAFELDAQRRRARAHEDLARERIDQLTRREAQVMECIVSGLPNKEIAQKLGISEKTVEVHRKRVLQKMGARNAVELVSFVMGARQQQTPPAATP